MTTKPNLLFITPDPPDPLGSGLPRRVNNFLEVLVQKYNVHLLIHNYTFKDQQVDSYSLELCHSADYIPIKNDPQLLIQRFTYKISPALFYKFFPIPSEWRYVTERQVNRVFKHFSNTTFDVIHICRLFLLPFAVPFLTGNFSGVCQLDIDDFESLTKHRISELNRLNGNIKMAQTVAQDAKMYEAVEKEMLPRFQRLFVCSELDKRKISQTYDCNSIDVIPNVVKIPELVPDKAAGEPFTFLFVGTLTMYTNRDAIKYFCEKILPMIRSQTEQTFRVKIVGAGHAKDLPEKLAHIPEVDFVGYVPDIAPYYNMANAIIVPLRAGGGTRIKILEAFSYKRPVVATSIGAEGIEIRHEEHLLIADTTEVFAQQCVRLIQEEELHDQLTENAFELVKTSYSLDAVRKALLKVGTDNEA